MNELMSLLKISSFDQVLSAYKKSGVFIGNCLDGGAGAGYAAKSMLPYIDAESSVFAFEPFPGNHKIFYAKNNDGRVKLIPKALAESNKEMTFYVPSTVSADSEWGRRGMEGYSSIGYLKDVSEESEKVILVDCVCADDEINPGDYIGFVKLDLQGGEYNALKGMRRILKDALFLWVEFIGDNLELYDQLLECGYMVFDTEYLFFDDPTEQALILFDVSNQGYTLSTGRQAWYGYKKTPWLNFKEEFARAKKDLGLVQTDLLCINKRKIKEFLLSAQYLE